LKSVEAEPQQVLLTVCFASALKNSQLLGLFFILNLKSDKAGPQQLQLTVKKATRGQSGGTKMSLRFLKKVHPLRLRFDVFKVPKRGRSGGTEK
jgi:hypothetical protein